MPPKLYHWCISKKGGHLFRCTSQIVPSSFIDAFLSYSVLCIVNIIHSGEKEKSSLNKSIFVCFNSFLPECNRNPLSNIIWLRRPQLDWCIHWEQEFPKQVYTPFQCMPLAHVAIPSNYWLTPEKVHQSNCFLLIHICISIVLWCTHWVP